MVGGNEGNQAVLVTILICCAFSIPALESVTRHQHELNGFQVRVKVLPRQVSASYTYCYT